MDLIRNALKNIGLIDALIHSAGGRIATPPTVPQSSAAKSRDSFTLLSREQLKNIDPKGILSSGRIHPELKERTERFLSAAEAQGLRVQLFEGFRSTERQKQLYESGTGVTNAKPGNSFHNYGLAVDVVFRDAKNRPSWDESHDWTKLGRLGKAAGLSWGGDWKKQVDRPHFQLLPADQLSKVKQLTAKSGIEGMWKEIL